MNPVRGRVDRAGASRHVKSGEEVVVKVQRRGIYEKMARDIELLRKAIKLMPPVSLKNMADLISFRRIVDCDKRRDELSYRSI